MPKKWKAKAVTVRGLIDTLEKVAAQHPEALVWLGDDVLEWNGGVLLLMHAADVPAVCLDFKPRGKR